MRTDQRLSRLEAVGKDSLAAAQVQDALSQYLRGVGTDADFRSLLRPASLSRLSDETLSAAVTSLKAKIDANERNPKGSANAQ
jgi:hypothetical protein